IWVNSHGSFPLLLGLVLLTALGLALDAWRRAGFRPSALAPRALSRPSAALVATALLVALAAFVNPYGLDLVRRVLDPFQPDSMTRFLDEWQPLTALPDGGPARVLLPALLLR